MKPEDVRIGMQFSAVDFSSYVLHVEGLDGLHALCRYTTCFASGRDKILLKYLVNEDLFRCTVK